jgi:succinyl-CoA synthetase alpha subunit
MAVKGIIIKGQYYDSVTLMLVAQEATKLEGVEDVAVVMGTVQNKSILRSSGLLLDEFKDAVDSELLIAVKAGDEKDCEEGIKKVQELLTARKAASEESAEYSPKSIDGALKILPNANMAIISVAGKYAAIEAMNALKRGLHVMIFSDNVPKEKAFEVKRYGREHGLLVMGPGCGTAIINGAPLGFANAVNRGDIGIVSAAGTGLQEVSCIISNAGGGISQAIGTGGIDVKKDYQGMSFLTGLEALIDDPETKVITLISKPPDPEVLEKIGEVLKKTNKPVVASFLGANPKLVKEIGGISVNDLEHAALFAVSISKGVSMGDFEKEIEQRDAELKDKASELAKNLKVKQKYFRGLFQGGTLAYETQVLLKNIIGKVNSNVPLDPSLKLEDSWNSVGHTVVDLGEDEFTVGRPHPQIDYELRNKRILAEAKDPSVAIIYLDVVIGYGTNPNPTGKLVPVIKKAKETSDAIIITTVIGTDKDPQNKAYLMSMLKDAGAVVFERNASATRLAGYILKGLGG